MRKSFSPYTFKHYTSDVLRDSPLSLAMWGAGVLRWGVLACGACLGAWGLLGAVGLFAHEALP